MNYSSLLTIHSWFRWAVLISLIITIGRAWFGRRNKLTFTTFDNKLRHMTATICHIQLMLGFWLYFISPIVTYFLNNFGEAVHLREIRFFGMEHITVMIFAILVITIGSMKAKRKHADREKFNTIYVWYSIGLLLILSSIPWSFLPLTSRPLLRVF
ncbi:hypothetical protein [Jiulongibacter sediminis]|uniref:Cytochrome B561 n=1 Tax=Jiulongibacter sediminis TaxID=1605367 RepID=A0A0P7C445_9BACT|nr:hypothetical protein [Jiulongibacter sediminis]KPM49099.1 hypothetical protein AFM12_00125 [Jiulongibacter sediminis]TBX26157.1 hypothetical protein TK44_00125 [Jiulongibacter sediminis]